MAREDGLDVLLIRTTVPERLAAGVLPGLSR